MKKWSFSIVLLLVTLIFLGAVGEVRAKKSIPDERQVPRLVDDADVLTDDEEGALLKKLDEVSERLQCDIVINTFSGAEYETMEQYADDYYDYNGFGYGGKEKATGILLAMDYKERDWHISTSGDAIAAVSDKTRKKIADVFLPYLSNGYTYKGFNAFIDLSEEVMIAHKEGRKAIIEEPDDLPEAKHSHEGEEGNILIKALLALGISLTVALIVVVILTGQLNTVHAATDAADYVIEGSFVLKESREFFLYRTVTKSKIEKSSRSGAHTSSSGRSHGGGGGKF